MSKKAFAKIEAGLRDALRHARTAPEYEVEVWQEGVCVATVCGTDLARVQSEAMHYALMYAQDGPEVTIKGLPAECFVEPKP